MSRPSARALLTAVAVAVAGISFPGPAAAQEAGGATLVASAGQITWGGSVGLSGVLEATEGCAAVRPIELQHLTAGASSWDVVATGATGADTTFAFSALPEHTGAFRAVAGATEECAEVVSPEVVVTVSALVANVLGSATLGAGHCTRVSVSVSPNKAGQEVRLQRARTWGWQTIATVAVAEDSVVVAKTCFGWDDIGMVRLRARWPAQDALNAAGSGPAVALKVVKARWMRRIDRLTAGRSISVSVREAGEHLYRRRDTDRRIPASNQKLLLSMAVLDALGPDFRFETRVVGPAFSGSVVDGNIWIVGRGDPTTARGQMRRLARRLVEAGIRRVRGSVIGSKTYFARDWWAPGWRWYFPSYHVALPTALTFRGNRSSSGTHVRDPERRAAAFLTRRLKALGVRVNGDPAAGRVPSGLVELASVRSDPLAEILRQMNVWSSNFHAEVLGKRLAVESAGAPGTIAAGARATTGWAADHGAAITAYDSSGLSYANRVTAAGLARLLGVAERLSWGRGLRNSLPAGGGGTLDDRLGRVRVRAKTGTLIGVSALSGYVWLERLDTWAEFSILSNGMSKSTAVRIEDAVVRILSDRAR
jgi:D-alanyl-D-alanine carboxypeptidase/D-alanyl-D-alanine-endopeptidase (penicillin-binding protein 4)